MKENKYSVKELKKITNQIVEEQKQEHGIEVNAFPVTLIEYYTDYVFKGKFSLQRVLNNFHYPYKLMGVYSNGNIIIFLNKTESVKKVDFSKGILEFLNTVYHELRHGIQKQDPSISYERYVFFLERYLRAARVKEFDYSTMHDEFLAEIDADLYGIRNASEYLQKWEPEIYEEKKDYIDRLEKKYLLNYNTYDASRTYDLAVTVMRNKYKKEGASCETIFMNEDGTFKSIQSILDDPILYTVDEKIVAFVMSSRTFLREIDFTELSYKDLKALNKILNYTKTIYNNQLNHLEEALKNKTIGEHLYSTKKDNIINNINHINYYIDKINLYIGISLYTGEKKK